MALPEVMPFEAVGPGGRTHDCYWTRVGKRRPKKGEYYVSGAIPMAYKARSDLTTEYLIVEPTHFAYQVRSWARGEIIKKQRTRA